MSLRVIFAWRHAPFQGKPPYTRQHVWSKFRP